MEGFLGHCVLVLLLVVVLGYINERFTKFTYEISLMLFSIITGGVCLGIWVSYSGQRAIDILNGLYVFDLQSFLMEGVLCFMLFAGSCHMKLRNFKKYAKEITLLSIFATLLGAIFYALLFFGAAKLLSLPLSLPVCLMFGSIVAPTDPIAATSILKKFNFPKNIGFLIESESLLNDGVGVAHEAWNRISSVAGNRESGCPLQTPAWAIPRWILTAGSPGMRTGCRIPSSWKRTCRRSRFASASTIHPTVSGSTTPPSVCWMKNVPASLRFRSGNGWPWQKKPRWRSPGQTMTGQHF